MPALTSSDIARRAIHLLAGTLGGVGLAALFFAGQPGPLALIGMITLCQAIAELFIARSYALALLFLTPLAIGMSNLGRNLPWSPLLYERAIEPGWGRAVVLVLSVFCRIALAKDALPRRLTREV